jgi:hypothetical protein
MYLSTDKQKRMEWSLLGNDEWKRPGALKILEKGVANKYTIINKSEVQLNTMNIKSVNECKWIVHVKDIKPDCYVIELFTMENVIVDTNNPMIRDVASFNNLFKEVYNELVMEINFRGELQAVLNAGDIRRKWLRVREQLKQLGAQNANVANVIQLNDNLFDDDKRLFEVIRAMEFFELFFVGFYGKELPGHRNMERNSKFRGHKLNWRYDFSLGNRQAAGDTLQVNVQGQVTDHLSEGFLKHVYGPADYLNYKTVSPKIYSEGRYQLDARTGVITGARYKNDETIDPVSFYSRNEYTIIRL